MKTLQEFYYFDMATDFITQEDAFQDLKELFDLCKHQSFHYGDCTSQNISCRLCELETILTKYFKYTKDCQKK